MKIARRRFLAGSAISPIIATLPFLHASSSAAQSVSAGLPREILDLLDVGDSEFPVTPILNRTITYGSTTYYVIEISQDATGIGEPVVVRAPARGSPIVLADFVGLPPPSEILEDNSDIVPVLFALPESDARPDRPSAPFSPTTTEAATAAQDKKVSDTAQSNVGLDTSKARGTKGGRLACAWAVNSIVSLALKSPILAGPQGLATANLVKVLRSRHVRVSTPAPGSIVISPTVYHPRVNIGHVGIVGADDLIYSNSSSRAAWSQNFTIDRWNSYFHTRKGLTVEYFRLDDVYFPPM